MNHLEILSQYTRPGVAISVAQQEALYREYLQAQLQQPLSGQGVEQAHSPSSSGQVNSLNQVSVGVQNVALPPLQPPMQPPGHRHPLWHQRTPSLMFHNNRIHLKVTFHTKHKPILPISCIMSLHLNPFMNPPSVIPPQQLFNPQPPVIPSPIPASTATYLPVPNIPQQNIAYSPQARLVPCPTAPKRPFNPNPNLNLWRFPQNTPPNVNQATNAAVFNNVQPNLPPSTSNPAISHHILQVNAQRNPNSNHLATCSIPVNPFSTTTNIAPPFVTPVIHPTYGHTAPIPMCWGGPPHLTPPAPASENASLIKAFTDALTSKRNDPLPEWKLSQYNGDPLL